MSSRIPANQGASSGGAELRQTETHGQRIERLFREHNESLVSFLNAKLQSRDEAKEVAQEAYVQLLGLHRPETVSFLKAYLFQAAINIARDRIKQKTRRRKIDEIHLFEPEREDLNSPEQELAAESDLTAMRKALDELPPSCRQAFELVRITGLSFDEAARRLGLHPRRVRRYVERAVQHCIEVLRLTDSPGGTP